MTKFTRNDITAGVVVVAGRSVPFEADVPVEFSDDEAKLLGPEWSPVIADKPAKKAAKTSTAPAADIPPDQGTNEAGVPAEEG